ncbi:MAG: MFS transporter [Chloroflexi bacterium]|nr:MFS transporter [Chloroflexota bacterium]
MKLEETTAGSRRRFFYGWVVLGVAVFGAFMGQGLNNSIAVFFKPLLTTFPSADRATLSMAASINMVLWGVMQPIMGKAIERFGPKRVIALASAVLAAGMLLMATVSQVRQVHLYFGVIAALGYAGGTVVTYFALIAQWFAEKKGLAMGIVSAGSSAGIMLVVPATNLVIISSGWRTAYVVQGLAVGLVLFPALLLLVRRGPVSRSSTLAGGTVRAQRVPISTALRHRPYQLVLLIMVICGFADMSLAAHLAALTTDRGMSPEAGGFALSLIGAGSAVGAIILSAVSDRTGRKGPLGVSFFIRAASLVLLLLVRDEPTLYLFALVFGLVWIVSAPLTSALILDTYGPVSVGTLFGLVTLAHQFGGSGGTFLAGAIFDRTGSYQLAIAIFIAATLVAGLASFMINEKKAKGRLATGLDAQVIPAQADAP